MDVPAILQSPNAPNNQKQSDKQINKELRLRIFMFVLDARFGETRRPLYESFGDAVFVRHINATPVPLLFRRRVAGSSWAKDEVPAEAMETETETDTGT